MLFRQVVNLPQAWYAMFGNSIIDPDYRPTRAPVSRPPARFPVEIRSLERMEQRWERAGEAGASPEVTPERKRRVRGDKPGPVHHPLSAYHHPPQQWWLLKHELFGEADPARANALLDQMVELAEREIANAQETIPLVERDSRLGFEPSMEYMTDRRHLEWKIAVVRRVVDHEIAQYRKALALVGR